MADSTFAWLSVSVKRGATILLLPEELSRLGGTVLLVSYFTQ